MLEDDWEDLSSDEEPKVGAPAFGRTKSNVGRGRGFMPLDSIPQRSTHQSGRENGVNGDTSIKELINLERRGASARVRSSNMPDVTQTCSMGSPIAMRRNTFWRKDSAIGNSVVSYSDGKDSRASNSSRSLEDEAERYEYGSSTSETPDGSSCASTPGTSREASPAHTPGKSREGSPAHTPGTSREDSPAHTPGTSREDSPAHTPGTSREGSPAHTPGKSEASPAHTPGTSRDDSPAHTPGTSRDDSPAHTPGTSRDDSPAHTPGTSRDDSSAHTPGTLREDSPASAPGRSREASPEYTPGKSEEASPEYTPGRSSGADIGVRKKKGKRGGGGGGGGVKGKYRYTGRKDNEPLGRPRRQRQEYIPNPDPADERELFSGGIASGRNFHLYDNIQVTVTGHRAPPNIERFEQAKLSRLVMENIRRCAYVKPTPVQKHALPIIRSGRDMMACAQTGSGKTAAFLLPTIDCLIENGFNSIKTDASTTPQLLVVTPTRELAIQIYIEAKKLSYASKLVIGLCYGGTAYLHQIRKMQGGCHILIGTPGRLLQFLRRGTISLSKLRHLVIDEADKMLDMSFLNDVESIIKHESIDSRHPPQVLMFSATFPEEIQRLASLYMRNYIFIAVGIIGAACADVEQSFYLVFKYKKKDKLYNLLQRLDRAKTLIFVEKKRTADILAAFLSEKGFGTVSMHGDRDQRLREEALSMFRTGVMDVLVATGVASRGLDIRGVTYVINYDMPKTVDEYVHRIGRTGRVGNRGLAFSFYDPETDYALASGIARLLVQVRQNIPVFLQETKKRNGEATQRRYGVRPKMRIEPVNNDSAGQPYRNEDVQ